MWTAFGEYLHQQKTKTNADRIRAMSDEELAKEFAMLAGWDRSEYEKAKRIGIEKVMLDWLKQPAAEPPKEEAQQDCTYNKDGHCIGQKLMPECDAKSCDRRKA